MVVCSLEECLCTVICALYETSKEIYILAAQASCRLRDDKFGGVGRKPQPPASVWHNYAMIACKAEGLGSLIFHSRHNCSNTPPIA
jgi:hypothetical protein